MKAIVLCGGLGTRLGSLTRATPKPILEIANRPFLSYVLDQLSVPEIEEIVLSVGFRWEKIQDLFGFEWRGRSVTYSIENQPLGTGGAIKKSMYDAQCSEALVVNGDSLLRVNPAAIINFARGHQADVALALKRMDNASRFGSVTIDEISRITGFVEKAAQTSSLINAGFYYMKDSIFSLIKADRFSLESDLLALHSSKLKMYGYETDSYFIDMGVPDDFLRAQTELKIFN
jgi:D-glycero-alpha-D-manno-heptose 1-phosphate guanylyltransferase